MYLSIVYLQLSLLTNICTHPCLNPSAGEWWEYLATHVQIISPSRQLHPNLLSGKRKLLFV